MAGSEKHGRGAVDGTWAIICWISLLVNCTNLVQQQPFFVIRAVLPDTGSNEVPSRRFAGFDPAAPALIAVVNG